jgi:preprotein translocase SecE subunit
MASVTNEKDEKTMATDVIVPGADEPGGNRPRERVDHVDGGGFFTMHKKGQGYWTRMLSAAAAGLLILLTVSFIWKQTPYISPIFVPENATDVQRLHGNALAQNVMLGVSAAVFIGLAMGCWYLMNRPGNVDFLIATDSEMKKVNWTSRKELIGSTKVVIFFMFLIAIVLFILDMYFTRLFYLIGSQNNRVLVTDSPMWIWIGGYFGTAGKAAMDVIMSVIVFGGAGWAVYSASKSK